MGGGVPHFISCVYIVEVTSQAFSNSTTSASLDVAQCQPLTISDLTVPFRLELVEPKSLEVQCPDLRVLDLDHSYCYDGPPSLPE